MATAGRRPACAPRSSTSPSPDGICHLWGNVGSEAERDALRVVAETTKGVREVKDHVRILPPSVVSLEPE